MRRRVLVVDDEPVVIDVVTCTLELAGFDVVAARNGYQALDVVAREPVDFVLLDVRMPGLRGDEVCVELRRRGVRVPIALFSADAHFVTDGLVERVGADAYWSKPLGADQLVGYIRRMLGDGVGR